MRTSFKRGLLASLLVLAALAAPSYSIWSQYIQSLISVTIQVSGLSTLATVTATNITATALSAANVTATSSATLQSGTTLYFDSFAYLTHSAALNAIYVSLPVYNGGASWDWSNNSGQNMIWDSGAPAGGGAAVTFTGNTNVSNAQVLAGQGSQFTYAGLNGTNFWGSHYNVTGSSAIAYLAGLHGTYEVGQGGRVDDANFTSVPIHWWQASVNLASNGAFIILDAARDFFTGNPSGRFNGFFEVYRSSNVTVRTVDYTGQTKHYGADGVNYLADSIDTSGHSAGLTSTDPSAYFYLSSGQGAYYWFSGGAAKTASITVDNGTGVSTMTQTGASMVFAKAVSIVNALTALGGVTFADGTSQSTAYSKPVSSATYWTQGNVAFAATAQWQWWPAVSTLTYTASGNYYGCMKFQCPCLPSGTTFTEEGFWVDGAFVDGEAAGVGFMSVKGANDRKSCYFEHKTKAKLTAASHTFSPMWYSPNSGTLTMNDNSDTICQFKVEECP